jgi:GntP family gluconate:H+ symporter
VLIGTQSVVSLIFEEGHMLRTVFLYLGWPVVALSIGVWLAYRNIKSDDDREKAKDAWVEAALKTSAMILVVTGLGGSLSAILRGTPAVDFIAALFTDYGLPTILLPFVIGIIGNMITGSTTVGVITAASLVAPMLASLSLSPEAAMLSGASGSVIIKYVNSSYFWVCTSLSRLSVPDAVFSYGGATLVGGIVSFLTVCAMWGIGLI